MSENPKCPYCGEEMEMRFRHRPDGTIWKGVVDPREIPYDAVVTYVDDNYHYYCQNCKVNTPYRSTREEAFAAAMKRDRAKGKWILVLEGLRSTTYRCSHCGNYFEEHSNTLNANCGDKKFCPHCGAEMREEANDER